MVYSGWIYQLVQIYTTNSGRAHTWARGALTFILVFWRIRKERAYRVNFLHDTNKLEKEYRATAWSPYDRKYETLLQFWSCLKNAAFAIYVNFEWSEAFH